MLRSTLSALALVLAGGGAQAAEIVSVYTDIVLERDCTLLAKNTEGGDFANLTCNGYRGFPVLIFSGDLRESLFYGFPPAGDLPWESFAAFNSTGPRIEWRIEQEGDVAVPFATIHRWFVNNDPEDPSQKTEVLVVAKVGQFGVHDGCAVGLVVASGNPKANETARRIADEQARTFACGADERVVVSGEVPLPEFFRQEP